MKWKWAETLWQRQTPSPTPGESQHGTKPSAWTYAMTSSTSSFGCAAPGSRALLPATLKNPCTAQMNDLCSCVSFPKRTVPCMFVRHIQAYYVLCSMLKGRHVLVGQRQGVHWPQHSVWGGNRCGTLACWPCCYTHNVRLYTTMVTQYA